MSSMPATAMAVDQNDLNPFVGWVCRLIARCCCSTILFERGQVNRQYRDHRLEWMIAGGGLEIVREGIAKGTIRFSRLPE